MADGSKGMSCEGCEAMLKRGNTQLPNINAILTSASSLFCANAKDQQTRTDCVAEITVVTRMLTLIQQYVADDQRDTTCRTRLKCVKQSAQSATQCYSANKKKWLDCDKLICEVG